MVKAKRAPERAKRRVKTRPARNPFNGRDEREKVGSAPRISGEERWPRGGLPPRVSRLGLAAQEYEIEWGSEYQEALQEYVSNNFNGKTTDDLTRQEIIDFEEMFFDYFSIDNYARNDDEKYGICINAPGADFWFPSLC